MENFTNETIDTTQLPRFEEVHLSSLHPKYKKVVLLNASVFGLVLVIAFGFLFLADLYYKFNRFYGNFGNLWGMVIKKALVKMFS